MQTIITKYIAPTNTKGSRIKVTSWLGSKTFSYDYRASCAHKAAFEEYMDYLQSKTGISYTLLAEGCMPEGTGRAFIVQ
ncbi:hypothetical protein [Providencia phage PSTCR7]|uniref:Uncharacterized protein n=1 Tax=Providencia phage PSTCR7 TaxID=2783549 RepID=A0A7S9SWD8_9CAUD|nr:hypothetical protein PQD10_gp50 [Providencia phage PSTCR7]QPI18502.1 hypothetical protein [Providencia phage PSTCR7]